MKILIDHQIFELQKFGGVTRYFNELLKINGNSIYVERIKPEDIEDKHSRISNKDLLARSVKFLKRKVGLLENNVQDISPGLRNILETGDYNIFHPTYFNPYFLPFLKKPFVLTIYDMIHEIYKESFPIGDIVSMNKRMLCAKADRIITISKTTKSDLIELFGIEEEKVTAIQLASDFDTILPEKPAKTEGIENYILFTGARWVYKNFYFTLLALSDVLKQDIKLQLLCTGLEFSKDELQLFANLGLSSRIKHIYLENDAQLAWAYRNARVFIFPSLYEGFGFPLLEAFASDCPVVSSNRGSLVEVGGNGPIYFDPKKIKEIQSAITTAIYDNPERINMVRKGRDQFNKFSWDKCRLETEEVYRSVMKN